MQELLDATHEILAELEREHKASKVPSSTGEPAKQDADADEMREKFRIVRVTSLSLRTLHKSGHGPQQHQGTCRSSC